MAKPYGLPKGARLRSRLDINAVFRRGRYHTLGFLRAKSLPTGRREARFLISVKKAFGNAPLRNRIKRLLREAIRLHRAGLSSSHDICFFFTARPPTPLAFSRVEHEVQNLFHRLSGRP